MSSLPQTYEVSPQATRLLELATCLCQTVLTETGAPLCWCGVYPGGVPSWDYCGGCTGGTCGMGFVTLSAASLYKSFGVPSPNNACDSFMQASVTLGIMRCLPMNDDGSPASADDMADTALLLMDDMLAIRKAALCCYEGDILLYGYEAIPAQGGCVGGLWRATVALD